MKKKDFDIIRRGVNNWDMYRDATVLVTGSTGRLGWYILETLVDVDLKYNLNMRIIGVARDRKKAESVFGETVNFPNVSFIYQDINSCINPERTMC